MATGRLSTMLSLATLGGIVAAAPQRFAHNLMADDEVPPVLALLQLTSHATGREPLTLNASSTPKCKTRVVVDVGLPRTATTSFTSWTTKLGYTGVHHAQENPLRAEFYANFFATLPSEPMSFADAPWALEGCILAARRPDTFPEEDLKFISVQRDPAAWRQSLKSMLCSYQFANENYKCPQTEEWRRQLWHGDYLANLNGHYKEVVKTVSFLQDFVDFTGWLTARWCDRFHEDVIEMCGPDEGSDVEAEVAVAATFMKHFNDKVRTCVGEKNFLTVQLEDDQKEQKMAAFLGCEGEIPEYPSADALDHK